MPQSFYSYMGSPLHLILEDDIADGYNRFVDAFIQAQINHEKTTGSKWQPNEPLLMDYRPEWHVAHEKIARIIKLLVEINGDGLDIPEELCTSDHLEKVV